MRLNKNSDANGLYTHHHQHSLISIRIYWVQNCIKSNFRGVFILFFFSLSSSFLFFLSSSRQKKLHKISIWYSTFHRPINRQHKLSEIVSFFYSLRFLSRLFFFYSIFIKFSKSGHSANDRLMLWVWIMILRSQMLKNTTITR